MWSGCIIFILNNGKRTYYQPRYVQIQHVGHTQKWCHLLYTCLVEAKICLLSFQLMLCGQWPRPLMEVLPGMSLLLQVIRNHPHLDSIIRDGNTGGRGKSPVGYLNDCGNFDTSTRNNNQLLCFNPSCNEWTSLRCTGSVPSPRSCCASAIMRHKVWLYGGDIGRHEGTDELLELNMHLRTWTQIQIHEPKPQALYCFSLNVLSDNTLVLHGGAQPLPNGGNHRHLALSNTWILNTSTQTWRQYKSTKDHSRESHEGITGLTGCVIITGGVKDPGESYYVYTTTFHVMLAPKRLQQLAMQTVFKYRNVLPWKCLPRKLKNLFGLTESEWCICDVRSCDNCN